MTKEQERELLKAKVNIIIQDLFLNPYDDLEDRLNYLDSRLRKIQELALLSNEDFLEENEILAYNMFQMKRTYPKEFETLKQIIKTPLDPLLMSEKRKVIAIDFDGTCVTHVWPEIGKDIGAVPVLKALVSNNWHIILFTMRSGRELAMAVDWFNEHGIPLFDVNENPEQHTWTKSPKPYAHIYIDDAALGCPLIYDTKISDRPFVDWKAVEKYLIENHYLLNPVT